MARSFSKHEKTTKVSTPSSARRAVFVALAMLLGGAAGLGALLGAAAATDRPPLFLLAGLIAFCAVYLLGLMLATREASPPRRRRLRIGLFCAGTVVVVGTFAWMALLPMDDPRLPPAPVDGQRFWELSTGSRIAYIRVPAEGGARKAPVIFLHGGPGTPDMKGDSEYFGRLARSGFDVYVYDELGTGRSSIAGWLVTFTGRQARLERPDARSNELTHSDGSLELSGAFGDSLKESLDFCTSEASR